MTRFSTLAFIGAAFALSGCMGTTGTTTTVIGGERLDPSAPAWTLASYLPDPNANTTVQTNPTADASFSSLFAGVRSSAPGGLTPLTWNTTLDNVAQSYAGYLVATDQFSHNAGGTTPGSRVKASGYVPSVVRENLAQGQTSEAQVMTSWQNSSGHNANLLAKDVTEFGLGVSGTGSKTTWVLILAAP